MTKTPRQKALEPRVTIMAAATYQYHAYTSFGNAWVQKQGTKLSLYCGHTLFLKRRSGIPEYTTKCPECGAIRYREWLREQLQ